MGFNLIRLKNILLSPLFIGIIFFLILQLQIFNYGFNYRDEGYLLNNAQRINGGELPYADFSLALTPGAFYIQALALKIFGNYIITDRILYILCVIFMLVLCYKLFKFSRHLNYIFLLFLALAYVGMGFFASYNMYGVVLILISLFFFNKLKNNGGNHYYPFLIGIANFLALIVKQTYGVVFFFTLLFLIIFFTKRKYLIKNTCFYLMGSAILPIIVFFIIYSMGATGQLINNVFYFALNVKSDRLPFISTAILFIPLFVFLVNFIKKFSLKKLAVALILIFLFFFLYIFIAPTRIAYLFSFYRQLTIYYFVLFFTVPLALITLFFKSKNAQKKQISILSIEAFSLFLASAFSGRDYTTVIVSASLYIPLFIYLFTTKCKKLKLPAKSVVITLLLILFIFPSIASLFKDYGKLYGIGFAKENYESLNLEETSNIKIPISQKKDLEEIINYIKNKTSQNDKLLCIPYCSFFNFISSRKNLSYFGFFYKFNKNDQNKVVRDIKDSSNPIMIIQKPGVIEREANYEDKNLNLLKTFIFKRYKLVKTTENFYIYKN